MINPNHPSFGTSCPVQYSVSPKPTAWSMAGFGCGLTGNHCIPDEHCASKRERHAKIQADKAMIEQALKGQQNDS